ncbi:MAG: GTPase HflX [Thaumarchaeota archaeon 13_1_40CM_38_12]|nr:MAG: GTPase HflX [Thaumarchaeota archaeon 13_1_40CM_38_12]OLC33880.1 MAG: GTPase HflX [Thaumarchaeota archaeon 13_1_40CM_4_38_7]OLC91366.1 MAG: GTPase HflX [Thaumarchaeota archaeon 13_1_40CM_3_38_6]OLD30952.1 MAG: GTPase HflX [Thaumarchaeota archaeon 13_1_40CM_2_39_7]TLY05382.1 MAG: GTPase HflX [Nitrososphaerota archaeon]
MAVKTLKDSAILITYDKEDATKEALALCEAAGYDIRKIIKQKFLNKAKFGVGEGKVEELKELVNSLRPDVIIYDEILKPSQNYNLASTLKMRVLDREALILEIFERRARSSESILQVKLAQLRYEMSRAKEKVRLAKMGEQPGFMGIGKFEVDVYSNDIKNRMNSTKSKLQKSSRQRALHRQARKRIGFKTASLSGYTSAGKTTLFNMLTGENKEESPNLFTTLSTTTRKFRLQKMEVLISDTVGFISKLPAYMIDAFKSTLEELNYTDIVIVVIDVNDTILELKKKFRSCVTTLDEIGVDKDKIIFVLNKSDLVSEEEVNYKADQLGLKDNKKWLPISSVTGQNISKLKDLIQQAIEDRPKLNAKDEVVKQEIEINYED